MKRDLDQAATPERYRRVPGRFWRDIAPQLSAPQQLIALYCLTHPEQMTAMGLSKFSIALAIEDMGDQQSFQEWLPEGFAEPFREWFEKQFAEACRVAGWKYDAKARVLWMPEWVSDNGPANPNVVASWRRLFDQVPQCALKTEAEQALTAFLTTRGDSFLKPFTKPLAKPLPERYAKSDNSDQRSDNRDLLDAHDPPSKRSARRDALPPRFRAPGPRASTLIQPPKHHASCYPTDGCARGLCMPGVLGRQWQQQLTNPPDGLSAAAAITAQANAIIAATPPDTVVADPMRWWREQWRSLETARARTPRPPQEEPMSKELTRLLDATGINRQQRHTYFAHASVSWDPKTGVATLLIPDEDIRDSVTRSFGEILESAVIAQGGQKLQIVGSAAA